MADKININVGVVRKLHPELFDIVQNTELRAKLILALSNLALNIYGLKNRPAHEIINGTALIELKIKPNSKEVDEEETDIIIGSTLLDGFKG